MVYYFGFRLGYCCLAVWCFCCFLFWLYVLVWILLCDNCVVYVMFGFEFGFNFVF